MSRLQQAFDGVIELPPAERGPALDRLAGTDATLARELRALLEAHERTGDFLGLLPQPAAASDESPVAPRAAGSSVGSYRIERAIGQGAAGDVYLAHDERLQRPVALKILRAAATVHPRGIARFLAEARAAAALDHPHVATVYEIGETQSGEHFIAMAYHDGGTLRDVFARGSVNDVEALRIATGVASGLAAAHARGIVHRDIKPANIILGIDGVPKIVDFGIARVTDGAATLSGELFGTPAYVAPEVLLGRTGDARVDLWSLGVVLHELLAGSRLFDGGSLPATLFAVVHADVPSLPTKVPEYLQRIVGRLLQRDPADRYPSAEALLADLRDQRGPLLRTAHGRGLIEPATSMLGRATVLQDVEALLASAPLVTLTGPGGIGKTRIALRVAATDTAHRDGAHVLPLAPIADPALVLPALASMLAVPEAGMGSLIDRVLAALRGRQLLLVLDNCEHLLETVAGLVHTLRECPGVRVLATSRAPLALQGEREYAVPPLSLDTDALQLFLDRTEAVRPGLHFDRRNLRAITEICRRLDGLPLAIELAAARTRVLTPVALLARLSRRFDLLASDARDLPTRHRTLRTVIAWSYDLLGAAEQTLFRRLSVFARGWTVSDAESLVRELGADDGLVIAELSALVSHSLVAQDGERDGEPRFQLLETMRDFGLERLHERTEFENVALAHARVMLALAEEAAPYLRTAQQTMWLTRLDDAQENLRAAIDHVSDLGLVEEAVRFGDALGRYWIARQLLREGRARLERILDLARDAESAVRARLSTTLGVLVSDLGIPAEAARRHADTLQLFRAAGDEAGVAVALNNLSWNLQMIGDTDGALAAATEALEMHTRSADVRGIATSHNNLAWIHRAHFGDPRTARTHAVQMLGGQRALGDPRGIAYALSGLAGLELMLGDHAAARACIAASQELLAQAGIPGSVSANRVWALHILFELDGDGATLLALEQFLPDLRRGGLQWGLGFALRCVADVALSEGLVDRANEALLESLAMARSAQDPVSTVMTLVRLASVATVAADIPRAAAYATEADNIAERLGNPLLRADVLEARAFILHGSGKPQEAEASWVEADALRRAQGAILSPRAQRRRRVTSMPDATHIGVPA